MVGTRSSTRKSCPPKGVIGATTAVGSKRKESTASLPKSKKGKKGDEKVQVTIEKALAKESGGDSLKYDVEVKDDDSQSKDEYGNPKYAKTQLEKGGKVTEIVVKEKGGGTENDYDEARNEVNRNAESANGFKKGARGFAENDAKNIENFDGERDESTQAEEAATVQIREKSDGDRINETKPKSEIKSNKVDVENDGRYDGNADSATAKEDAFEESSKRKDSTPSSILEKGIIYFFFRGRVNTEETTNVGDVARSYIVLRPILQGAKFGDGPIGDAGTNRLLALPKKVLPTSNKDRFMVFVEKANASLDEIKSSLAASDYMTKTAGARHTPSATPIGEGVYAITKSGRETHLAYILTIPSELGEVQKDIGLEHRGSFVTSAKNPQHPGPQNANLSESPSYPREIIDEFRSLRWMPLQPKLLDYTNTQFLFIGHSSSELEKATESQPKAHESKKDACLEEMENLEHEDELRVKHLKGDDSVFVDLGLSFKEYPKVPTTW